MTAGLPSSPAESVPRRSGNRVDGGAQRRLIDTAARLFAAKGIEGVSLREITREAGQRNTTALQYHFGDREGILLGVVEAHVADISHRRHALLDHFSATGDCTLRDCATVLVSPLVSKLNEGEPGANFLQVAAHLVNRSNALVRPEEPLGALIYDPLGSMARWAQAVEAVMAEGTAGAPLHRRFAAVRFAHIELGRRARDGSAGVELFARQLIDLVAAILGAELSPATRRLLETRQPDSAKSGGRWA